MSEYIHNDSLLPDGSLLVKDEKISSKRNFPVSIATFYINSTIVATNKRFIAHFPNTFLGILPLGFTDINMNLKQISSVTIRVQYYFFRLLIGALLILGSLGTLSENGAASIFWLIIGILLFGSGISPYISIGGAGGENVKVPVVFLEKIRSTKICS